MSRVRRHERLVDWYAEGDESVALVEHQVLALTAVPTTLVALTTEHWQPLADLVPPIVERFGDPPEGAETLLAEIAWNLGLNGILEFDETPQSKD